jgi:hypothetical protein
VPIDVLFEHRAVQILLCVIGVCDSWDGVLEVGL